MIAKIKYFRVWHFNHTNRERFDISVWDTASQEHIRDREIIIATDQAQKKNKAISKVLGNPSVMIVDGGICLEWKQVVRSKKEVI